MKKKRAFTLIELIAVLVILAILALIVTPLVMNIIKKAKDAANKRSIDAYGRSVEIAIANHLLETGTFPTNVSQLTIEYTGKKVVCETAKLNSDSSVYLTGCKVAGRSVDYTYGTEEVITYDAYEVGDEVSYNNVDYYVIKDSGTSEANVTLLKATPLTTAEVNQYGAGHVNRYTDVSVETAYDQNGYGGMAYYTSETCGYVNNNWIETDCTTDYKQSEVKYVVDAWKTDKAPDALEARIITYDDLTDNLGYEKKNEGTIYPSSDGTTPSWLYNSQYMYWTMSQYSDSTSSMWIVDWSGNIYYYDVDNCVYIFTSVVRPVITISISFFN